MAAKKVLLLTESDRAYWQNVFEIMQSDGYYIGKMSKFDRKLEGLIAKLSNAKQVKQHKPKVKK